MYLKRITDFFRAVFDLQENKIWSFGKYAEEKDWNFCLWLVTTVSKIINLGKQWACFSYVFRNVNWIDFQ